MAMTKRRPETSEATTEGVRVSVEAAYEPEHSQPETGHWLFSYRVHIVNEGERTVQLLSRRWVVTDGDGEQQVVEGPGVVGEQPVLAPGEAFEYSSFCPLTTPVGTMEGSYWMATGTGAGFEAEIAPFTLAVPGTVN
jgi:ApaG protein